MQRFLTLVSLLCLAIPAGISVSGCSRNPGANTCNGLGYGLKVTDVYSLDLEPRTTGISLAFGQEQQLALPTALTCKGTKATVTGYSYGSTNLNLVDISPNGNLCAGTWNRNSGGGISDYTICQAPNPLPQTGGAPYASAYVTAEANSVVSNPVQIYVHPLVTSVTLVGPQGCQTQGAIGQLDAQACYSATVGGQPTTALLCKPPTMTDPSQFACPQLASSVPDCTVALGPMSFSVLDGAVASINNETNQITAEQPGTTGILAAIAGSGSSAGYFSTCPPRSIQLTLANGSTIGTVNASVTQNLTTNIVDTQGKTITGVQLDYQSTDPIDISVNSTGAVTTSYPGTASITAICQPYTCNYAPVNQIGVYGTGLSIASNPVTLTYQGANSNYVWFAAPGKSQYVVPFQLLNGTVGSTVRLPFVPNSMVMDALGINIYFGSSTELMIYNTTANAVSKQDASVQGVVLAVSPDNSEILINDPILGRLYLYSQTKGLLNTFNGLATAAQWTPDSKTLYVSDSAAANNLPENVAAGITGHTDTLYVYNAHTGWSTYALPCSTGASCATPSNGGQSLAITVPSVGAYVSGSPTVAHTWCPQGTAGDYQSMSFYPLGDTVYTGPDNSYPPLDTDVLAATNDGNHILGATLKGNAVTLSDLGVTIPTTSCPETTTGTPPNQVQTLDPLMLSHVLNQTQLSQLNGNAITQVDQIVPSPASNLAFILYSANDNNYNALLPYYKPVTGNPDALGTVGYITLSGSTANSGPTAPVAGAFSPDDSLFFVSTAGDDLVHFISVPTLTDTQQIAPGLPACTPVSQGGLDLGCDYTGTSSVVPATAIVVKPRTTT